MAISDQRTGGFGYGMDGSFVPTIELHGGNMSAEYGSKISDATHIPRNRG